MKAAFSPFLLQVYVVLLLSSCGSMIGNGLSQRKGNLAMEETNTGTGVYAEYRWKKMIELDTWDRVFTRNGLGVDYNFRIRGNTTNSHNVQNTFFQSIQGKYYYTLLNPTSSGITLDLGIGAGTGSFYFDEHLFTKTLPFVSSLSLDLYFPNNHMLVLSSKVNYFNRHYEWIFCIATE